MKWLHPLIKMTGKHSYKCKIKILNNKRNHSMKALTYHNKRPNRMTTPLKGMSMRNKKDYIQIKLLIFLEQRDHLKCIIRLKEKDFLKISTVRCI